MSKLTIEDIMPYIPFGLKVKVKEKPDEIWTVEGKNIDGLLEMSLDKNTTAMSNIDNIIPIGSIIILFNFLYFFNAV